MRKTPKTKATSVDRPRITVGVWDPLFEILNGQAEKACLRRDTYLDRVLTHEAGMLEEEVEKPNSPEARDYVSRHLFVLKRTPVSLALQADTIKGIDDVCGRLNVVRDAFINRVFLFLVARPKLFQEIFDSNLLEINLEQVWERVFSKHYHINEVGATLYPGGLHLIQKAVEDDPFWAIRACIEEARNVAENHKSVRLHRLFIKPTLLSEITEDFGSVDLAGLNCWIDDWRVEGTKQYAERTKRSSDLLRELMEGKS